MRLGDNVLIAQHITSGNVRPHSSWVTLQLSLRVYKWFRRQDTQADTLASQRDPLTRPLKLTYGCKVFIPSMDSSCSRVCQSLDALEITLGPQAHLTPQPRAGAPTQSCREGMMEPPHTSGAGLSAVLQLHLALWKGEGK